MAPGLRNAALRCAETELRSPAELVVRRVGVVGLGGAPLVQAAADAAAATSGDLGAVSNHTGASTEELRDGLVAVALDKVLLLHVGTELAKH